LIYNDTGTNYQDFSCSENTHYYYQAWSWSQTDGFTANFVHADNITYANQPSFFESPPPSNGSINNSLSLSWNISINDTNGDLIDWTINCSNGQTNSSTSLPNGTKSLSPPSLADSTMYTILCEYPGDQNDYVVFGEAPDANDGPPVDSYDVPKPPAPMTPYVRVWFNDTLPSPYDTLSNDIRHSPDTSKIWNLTVQWMPSSGSSPTTITLSWNTAELVTCEYNSVALCTEGGSPIQNMLINSTYSFSCPAYVPYNFKIICNVVNQSPVVTNIPDQMVVEGSAFTAISLDNYVSDPDNTDAEMTWTYSGNTALTVSIVDRVATITIPNADWNGAETITFNASDPAGLWDATATTFTVTAVNDPPVITTVDTTTAVADVLYLVDYESTDVDGGTPIWSLVTNASFLGMDVNTGVLSGTPLNADVGSYSVNVSVSDGFDSSDFSNFSLTVINASLMFTDNSPTQGTTGDPFTFNITTLTIIEISNVTVTWTHGILNGTNASLILRNNETWNLTITLDHNLSAMNYSISVTDASNTTITGPQKIVNITDNDKPEIIDQTPTMAQAGHLFIFNMIVNENIQLSQAKLEYWFNNYAHISTNMINVHGNLWQKPIAINMTVQTLKYTVSVVDSSDNWVNTSEKIVYINPDRSPNAPARPTGVSSGKIGMQYTYKTSTTDPDGDEVYYQWDWGGNISGWLGPFASGEIASVQHTWEVKGTYEIKVKAKDIQGLESSWSDPLPVSMPYIYNPIHQFLDLFFQRYPYAFPFLRHLLGY